MKAPTSTQVTIALGIVGLLVVYYGVNKVAATVGSVGKGAGEVYDKAVKNIKDGLTAIADAPGKAAAAVGDYAAQQGMEFQGRYVPQDPVLQGLTGRVYADPLVDNDGRDFRYLSG